jgi:hypothetical protein
MCSCRRLDKDDYKRVLKQGMVIMSEVGLSHNNNCSCCHSFSFVAVATAVALQAKSAAV